MSTFCLVLAMVALAAACGPPTPSELGRARQAVDDPNRFGTPIGWDGTLKAITNASGTEPPSGGLGTETWSGTTSIVGSVHLAAYSGSGQFATWTGTVTGNIQVSCLASWAPLNPGDSGESKTETGGADFTLQASAQFSGPSFPGGPSFLLTVYATDAAQNTLTTNVTWTYSSGPHTEQGTEYISGYFPQTPLTLPSTGLQINSSHPAEMLASPCAPRPVPGLYEVDLTPITAGEMLVLEGGPGYNSWRPQAYENDAPSVSGPPVSSSRRLDTSEDGLSDGAIPPGSFVPVHAFLKMGDGSPIRQKATKITFTISSSSVPGEANNAPLPSQPNSKEPDLQFDPDKNGALSPSVTVSGAKFDTASTADGATYTDATAIVASYDWGGYATVTAVATMEDGTPLPAQILGAGANGKLLLPRRSGTSKVADVWKEQHGVTDKSDDDDSETVAGPAGASSPIGRPNTSGDGLTLYDEYRGFEVNHRHFDTDPLKIDFFLSVAVELHNSVGGGLDLLQGATGVVVHSDFRPGLDFDMGTREINFNRDTTIRDPQKYPVQHLVLLTTAPPSPYPKAFAVSDTVGDRIPNTPAGIDKIRLQQNAASNSDFSSIVAHELGHAIYVAHHGEDPNKKRHWTHTGSQVMETIRPQDTTLPVTQPVPIDVFNADDGTAQTVGDLTGFLSQPTLLVSSATGGPASGEEMCFMRYNTFQARAWNKGDAANGNRYTYDVVVDKEPAGTRICTSPNGQSFNADSLAAPSRWGKATQGDCAHQIVVNDLYKDKF